MEVRPEDRKEARLKTLRVLRAAGIPKTLCVLRAVRKPCACCAQREDVRTEDWRLEEEDLKIKRRLDNGGPPVGQTHLLPAIQVDEAVVGSKGLEVL